MSDARQGGGAPAPAPDAGEAGEAKPACPTCRLTDPFLHPCDSRGNAYPCPDEFHRECAVRKCAEPGCEVRGLTKKREWRCVPHMAPAPDSGGAASENRPLCEMCAAPAVVFGRYRGNSNDEWACRSCSERGNFAPASARPEGEALTLWRDEAGHLHLTRTARRTEYRALPAAQFDALVSRAAAPASGAVLREAAKALADEATYTVGIACRYMDQVVTDDQMSGQLVELKERVVKVRAALAGDAGAGEAQ